MTDLGRYLPVDPSFASRGAQLQPAPGPQARCSWYAPGFSDLLGDRLLLFDNTDHCSLEMLRLRAHLTKAPGFERNLRERTEALRGFEHPSFARVYSIDCLEGSGGALAIVSAHVAGPRLSEVLSKLSPDRRDMPVGLALILASQLVQSVAAMQLHAPGMAHGALSPERLVLTQHTGLIVVEHTLGAALATLGYDSTRCWSELGLASIDGQRDTPFGPRTDVLQLGLIALAMIIGQPISQAPSRGAIEARLEDAAQILAAWDPRHGQEMLVWLCRALQRDGRHSYASVPEAAEALSFDDRPTRRASNVLGAPEDFRPEGAEGHAIPLAGLSAGINFELPGTTRLAIPERHVPATDTGTRGPSRLAMRRVMLAAVGTAALVLVTTLTIGAMTPSPAILRLDTNPSGASVRIDGRDAGLTPLRLAVDPGEYILDVSKDGATRRIVLSARNGTDVSQYVELPPPTPVLPPVVAAVALGGPAKRVGDLPSREASSHAPSGLVVSAPVPLEVLHEGEVIGRSGAGPIALPPGVVEVELLNRDLEFHTTATVTVARGQATTLAVAVPRGTLNVNAQPWADVWIDGARAGETPLGNISLPIGPHRVVFQHPDLGAVSQEVLVKAGSITRVTADLRR